MFPAPRSTIQFRGESEVPTLHSLRLYNTTHWTYECPCQTVEDKHELYELRADALEALRRHVRDLHDEKELT